MLSNRPTTPRPKPPAVMRRSLLSPEKTNDFPPPPYETPPTIRSSFSFGHQRTLSVSSVGSNADSPVKATAQMLGIEIESSKPEDKTSTEEYISERSRDELAKLLLKAESVIRARERELGVAAAVGKQLLDANLQLRERHELLLSKYPGTPPEEPSASILPFPTEASSYESDHSPIKGASLLSTLSGTTPPRANHGRKPSASPQVLAALSEQNSDLLAQMQHLQDETSRANLEGKRKLRQLEKEIAGLRAELDIAQERNGQLEERIEKVQTEHERQVQDQLKEKERLKMLRSSPSGNLKELQDFAPANPLSAPSTPYKRLLRKRGANINIEEFDSDTTQVPPPPSDTQSPTSPPATARSVSANEFAVIGQLLGKIEELEQANRDIIREHREREEQLRRVTQEADTIRKIYDDLEDEVDFGDDEQPSMRSADVPQALTGSWRRTVTRKSSSSLRIRSLKDRGSPVSSLRSKAKAKEFPKNIKARKPLSISLFVKPESQETVEDQFWSTANTSVPNIPKIQLFSEDSDNEHDIDSRLTQVPPSPSKMHWPSSPKFRDSSPSSRYSSLSKRKSRVQPGSSIGSRSLRESKSVRTLQSELGKEFGEDWGSKEARSEFLFSDFEPDPTEGTGDQTNNETLENALVLAPSLESSQSITTVTIPAEENPAVAAIREALEPKKYGKLLAKDEHILPVGSLIGSPGETFFLLSHAVQSRPNIWQGPNADRAKNRESVDWTLKKGLLTYDSVNQEAETGTVNALSKHVRRLSQGLPEDPWEEHKYPDSTNETTDVENSAEKRRRAQMKGKGRGTPVLEYSMLEEGGSPSKSLGRRAAAQYRLENTASRRVSLRPGLPEFDERTGSLRRVNKSKRGVDVEIEEEAITAQQVKKPVTFADNVGQTLMELWILIQAAIIIIVFVYSMARRGPRAILDAAEVKRRV